jgi:hypothetical protein
MDKKAKETILFIDDEESILDIAIIDHTISEK